MIAVIKNNYDKKEGLIKGPSQSCVVDESNRTPTTTMHHLNVYNASAADMYLFPTEYISGMGCITTSVSSKLLDSNCDGMVLLYSQDRKMHIILAELKSCPPGSGLSEAFKQLVFSFIKYYTLFSICREWNINENTIDFVIACSCSKDPKALEAELYSAQNDMDMICEDEKGKPKDFVVSIFTQLYLSPQKKINLFFRDLQMLQGLELNEQILNKTFTLCLATTSVAGDDHADITFNY